MALSIYRQERDVNSGADILAVVRHLSSNEEEDCRAAIEILSDFERNRDLLDLVAANLEAVREEFDAFELRAKTVRKGALVHDPNEHRRLQRVVLNFLNAVRLYLDHRQTHLTRRFGKDSPELRAFNDCRRSQHQRIPEYAFVYELRNYVTHCGMPLQVIRGDQQLVEIDGREVLHANVMIGCNRDELLANFRDWNYSRDFIQSQQREFPILAALHTMKECLDQIEIAVIQALMPSLWNAGRLVVGLMSEGCDADAIGLLLTLSSHPDSSTRRTISFLLPPFDVLSWLQLVVLTDDAPGYRVLFDNLAIDSPPIVDL